MSARRVGSLLTVVVLVTSATYMLVYLYRWEWNRAMVSGLFFLAAELALIGSTVLRRLRRIEERLERVPAPRAPSPVLEVLHATAPVPPDRFAWLDERARSFNVFVPVLLGAGAILSLVAHLVERLAGMTARPALERGLAVRLERVALPVGGLQPAAVVPSGLARRGVADRLAGRGFVAAVAVLGIFGTVQVVDLIADATQTRSDPELAGASELTMAVHVRGRVAGVDETAEALWVACRNVLNRRVTASTPEPLGASLYRMRITPGIGRHAQRRLVGCLEDATLDRVSADVITILGDLPAEPGEPTG